MHYQIILNVNAFVIFFIPLNCLLSFSTKSKGILYVHVYPLHVHRICIFDIVLIEGTWLLIWRSNTTDSL